MRLKYPLNQSFPVQDNKRDMHKKVKQVEISLFQRKGDGQKMKWIEKLISNSNKLKLI
jgi:hypothetical protein